MNIIDIEAPKGFSKGYQKNTELSNYKYCFKYEYGENGKRCLIVGDDLDEFIRWFNTLPVHKRTLYELIRETDKVAEYYDIDVKLESSEITPDNFEDYCNENSENIIRTFLNYRNNLSSNILNTSDLIVLQAHTPTKLSLHIISKKTYYECNKLQQYFANLLYDELARKNCDFNIDKSVYSKNRCFRMFQNHKFGKQNPLKLMNPSKYGYHSLRDTLVILTHRDTSKRFHNVNFTVEELNIAKYNDTNESLSDDLMVLLKDFIDKHPYLTTTFNESNQSINRIDRIDHRRRKCLTDPNDYHSTENMYWYIRNCELYVSCFCNKGKHILLGRRKGVFEVQMEPEPFTLTTHYDSSFTDYTDLGKFKTVFDKRFTGRGKTTSAMKYAQSFEKVLLIHHRISLDDDYILKYPEFKSYKTCLNANKQTVCYNSLSKIDIEKYDLIIIDEIRSILKQSEMKNMIVSTHLLFNIFEKTNIPLIMLDANMTEQDIHFISQFRQDPNRIIINSEFKKSDKSIYVYDDENILYSKIQSDLKKNEKVIIIYNIAISRMNSLLNLYKDKRILHINKLTREKCNMLSDDWYDLYDIIAYSPTISEGFSVTDKRFQNVNAYGFFVSTSSPAESVSQMIARFRAVTAFSIYVNDKIKRGLPTFASQDEVYSYLNINMSLLSEISNFNYERKLNKIRIIKDQFCDLYCKNYYEMCKDYNQYRVTLLQKLINNGYRCFNVTGVETEYDEQMLGELLQSEERERLRKIQNVMEAELVQQEEYTNIRSKGIENENELWKVTKYDICRLTNVKPEYLDKALVSYILDHDELYNKIRNLVSCFTFTRQDDQFENKMHRIPTNVTIMEDVKNMFEQCNETRSFLEQKMYILNTRLTKLLWMDETARILGFKHLTSPEPVPEETFNRQLGMILNMYKTNYSKYYKVQTVFGENTKQPKTLTDKFVTRKFDYNLGLVFFKVGNLIYQKINIPYFRLYDAEKKNPSICGRFILEDEMNDMYKDIFLVDGENWCRMCKTIYSNKEEKECHEKGNVHVHMYKQILKKIEKKPSKCCRSH